MCKINLGDMLGYLRDQGLAFGLEPLLVTVRLLQGVEQLLIFTPISKKNLILKKLIFSFAKVELFLFVPESIHRLVLGQLCQHLLELLQQHP